MPPHETVKLCWDFKYIFSLAKLVYKKLQKLSSCKNVLQGHKNSLYGDQLCCLAFFAKYCCWCGCSPVRLCWQVEETLHTTLRILLWYKSSAKHYEKIIIVNKGRIQLIFGNSFFQRKLNQICWVFSFDMVEREK